MLPVLVLRILVCLLHETNLNCVGHFPQLLPHHHPQYLPVPKCSSVDEWIKQLWDIYMMEYHLPVKRGESFAPHDMDGPREHYA